MDTYFQEGEEDSSSEEATKCSRGGAEQGEHDFLFVPESLQPLDLSSLQRSSSNMFFNTINSMSPLFVLR